LSVLLGSMGHRVKIHKITPATSKERGWSSDIEIKDYVVLQKPRSHIKLFGGSWLIWLLGSWAWLSKHLIIRQRAGLDCQALCTLIIKLF
jgi:hypothetical protein